jgi:phospholipid/cholesterol/gamma-HCH transport system permease protein
MAVKGPERWTPGINLGKGLSGAMGAVGGLFSMGVDAV